MKLIGTVALIVAVLLLAYYALVRPHRHPMAIDANLRTDCIILPMRDPLTPRRKTDA